MNRARISWIVFLFQPYQAGLTGGVFPDAGSWSDPRALKMYKFDLPEGSLLTGDKAYNDYSHEDLLQKPKSTFNLCERKTQNDLCLLGSPIFWPVNEKLSRPLEA
jgi:hypothetical protein